MIRILDALHGDQRVTWDKGDLNQIRDAKKLFIELVTKGLKPYYVKMGGQPSAKEMREFDANAEEIVFIAKPMVVGG